MINKPHWCKSSYLLDLFYLKLPDCLSRKCFCSQSSAKSNLFTGLPLFFFSSEIVALALIMFRKLQDNVVWRGISFIPVQELRRLFSKQFCISYFTGTSFGEAFD